KKSPASVSSRAGLFHFKRQRPLLAGSVELCGLIPIDHVPPGIDVIGAYVLILQVVGVLPNINSQNCLAAEQVRRVLIGGRVNRELAVLHDQPGPAGAKSTQAGGFKLVLKSCK